MNVFYAKSSLFVVDKNKIGLAFYKIKGFVFKKGIKIPCRVDLYYRNTKKLAKTVTTDNQGYYQFDDIELGRYFIVAHDPDGEYNAVIQDNIIPK